MTRRVEYCMATGMVNECCTSAARVLQQRNSLFIKDDLNLIIGGITIVLLHETDNVFGMVYGGRVVGLVKVMCIFVI